MPRRIQLRRAKGYRKPEGAIYVGRPTIWGNPYRIDLVGREKALALFACTARGVWYPGLLSGISSALEDVIYRAHCTFLERLGMHPIDAARVHLAGHDLACWCPLSEACHADVWLLLANPGLELGPTSGPSEDLGIIAHPESTT